MVIFSVLSRYLTQNPQNIAPDTLFCGSTPPRANLAQSKIHLKQILFRQPPWSKSGLFGTQTRSGMYSGTYNSVFCHFWGFHNSVFDQGIKNRSFCGLLPMKHSKIEVFGVLAILDIIGTSKSGFFDILTKILILQTQMCHFCHFRSICQICDILDILDICDILDIQIVKTSISDKTDQNCQQ